MLNFDGEIQKQLIYAALDDFSPNDALPSVDGGQFGPSPEKWKVSVIGLIVELLSLKLIEPVGGDYGVLSNADVEKILKEGDGKNNLDVDLVWDVIHFAGTEKLKSLLDQCGLNHWAALNSEVSVNLRLALSKMAND